MNRNSRNNCLLSSKYGIEMDEGFILVFDYQHAGRPWVRVYIQLSTLTIRYVTPGGMTTEWHGHVAERGNFNPDGFHEERHQLMLQDFRSPWAPYHHNLLMTQVGPLTWKGKHDRSRENILMVMIYPDRFRDVARPPCDMPDILVVADYDDDDFTHA